MSTNMVGPTRQQLYEIVRCLDERPYRAQQIMKWIYHHGVSDFSSMTNLSKKLRDLLTQTASIRLPKAIKRVQSVDGTIKWVFQTDNGNAVETVLIPDKGRHTLCISSQIGCMLDCKFCATGKQGFNGNLDRSEIVGQVLLVQRYLYELGLKRITNIVFMGMGEPLLNFDETISASELLQDDMAFGLSKRRVTISTAGVVPAIHDMCEKTEVALAISLHAPTDDVRDDLVPINRKYPIRELLEACQRYLSTLNGKRYITIEYTLIKGVNDSISQARELAKLLRVLRCKINLIPFNPFPASGFEKPELTQVNAFRTVLIDAGYATTLRTTRGIDIAAACGQLTGEVTDRTKRQKRYQQRLKIVNESL